MSRKDAWSRIGGILIACSFLLLPGCQQGASNDEGLRGTVKSSDGKTMEGVAVSAQGQGKTFTTSVYTNHDGEYYFPPLESGSYRVWAQAVGFDADRSELTVAVGKEVEQDFTLRPLQDFEVQLSGTEWVNSLPADSPEDRRMKRVFHYTCGPASGCHLTNFILAKRFDAAGWDTLIDYMMESQTAPGSVLRKTIEGNKDDLVRYLARIRGPEPYPWKFKPLPRVTGDATEIVVTEYDVPRGDRPDDYSIHTNGSDWTQGVASRMEGNAAHDAVLGHDGNIYFTDDSTPERTVGKLDPKTGKVTSYKLPDQNGFAVSTHGIVTDPEGSIWLTNGTEGTILKFDPGTEKFQRFPKPSSMTPRIGGTLTADAKGNLWATQPTGVFRLNPKTGEYTEYKSVTPGGNQYGITIDSEGNAWFAHLGADRVGYVNGQTGEVGEVVIPPASKEIDPKDREIAKRSGALIDGNPSVYQSGPRRLGADPKGDTVWVGEYFAGRLGKIDIHTKKYTGYEVPNPASSPYDARVDKNHMVWVALMNSDRIAKFDPVTEQFTEYPFPTLGTDTRFIEIDNSTDPPTIWIPYYRPSRMARIQFRTAPHTAKSAEK